jgi:hypothetical protein
MNPVMSQAPSVTEPARSKPRRRRHLVLAIVAAGAVACALFVAGTFAVAGVALRRLREIHAQVNVQLPERASRGALDSD